MRHDRTQEDLEHYFCFSDSMCGLASCFGDMAARVSGCGSDSPYIDSMSDGLLRQIARHRAVRARLERLSKQSLIVLAEYYQPPAYALNIRSGYYSRPYYLHGIAQYTDLAESKAVKVEITPRQYIERVITTGHAKDRETIIAEARILLFAALSEYRETK